MMAPHYEQARMLCAAVEHAVHELGEPIDRIEVTAHNVHVRAGAKRLTMTYYYANAYGPDGSAAPGGGHWVVQSAGLAQACTTGALARLHHAVTRLFSKQP